MGHQIDLRGLSCPQPVIHTDKALKESPEATLVVIVDNPAARDNVVRLAKSKQRKVFVEEKDGDYYLTIEGPAS
jgi:TusA-related sulfurtransferase